MAFSCRVNSKALSQFFLTVAREVGHGVRQGNPWAQLKWSGTSPSQHREKDMVLGEALNLNLAWSRGNQGSSGERLYSNWGLGDEVTRCRFGAERKCTRQWER